ncbi:MAG: SufE family protein [Chromatiales bacterium]|nr:SufE family protein [Chromatiales bacterium]
MNEQIDRIVETFEFFEDWDDRYNYMAELGQKLPAFPEADHLDDNKVHGCVSQVWITVRSQEQGGKVVLQFQGDSDTAIIKGIVAILLSIYSGKTAEQALEVDVDAIFERLGIFDHLSPNRHVGVYAMVEKFRALAGGERARLAA